MDWTDTYSAGAIGGFVVKLKPVTPGRFLPGILGFGSSDIEPVTTSAFCFQNVNNLSVWLIIGVAIIVKTSTTQLTRHSLLMLTDRTTLTFSRYEKCHVSLTMYWWYVVNNIGGLLHSFCCQIWLDVQTCKEECTRCPLLAQKLPFPYAWPRRRSAFIKVAKTTQNKNWFELTWKALFFTC